MRLLVILGVALAVAMPAGASERRPTLTELESEIVCPTCRTTLDQSSSPVAERMRTLIRARIAAGDTKSEIKAELVRQFGPRVVQTAPPRRGFDLLAWLLPIGGIAAAASVLSLLAWRWTRSAGVESAAGDAQAPVDPELARRVDEELVRFEG